MPIVPLSLPLGSYLSEVSPLSAQRVINWIPVVSEDQSALSSNILLQRYGLKQFSDTLNGTGRGQHVMAGVHFSVNGSILSSTSTDGVSTNLGTITGTNRVVMADSGTLLVIVVPGGDAFVWNGSIVQQITDTDFQVSDTVVFYRGLFKILFGLSKKVVKV